MFYTKKILQIIVFALVVTAQIASVQAAQMDIKEQQVTFEEVQNNFKQKTPEQLNHMMSHCLSDFKSEITQGPRSSFPLSDVYAEYLLSKAAMAEIIIRIIKRWKKASETEQQELVAEYHNAIHTYVICANKFQDAKEA